MSSSRSASSEVQPDHRCAPSRSSTSAIAAPIPREAPVTSAPSRERDLDGRPGRPTRDLAGHVRRARREEEPQRRAELVLGALLDVDQVTVAPRAGLLAERAREALQRLRAPPAAPSTITRPDGCDPRDRRIEERCSSTSSSEDEMPDASKTSALNFWSAGACGLKTAASSRRRRHARAPDRPTPSPRRRRCRERPRGRRREPRPAPPSSTRPETGAGLALELDRLRQPDTLRDVPADRQC